MIHFSGKYNGDPESLPRYPHRPGAVPFREAEDTKTLSIIANVLSLLLIALLGFPVVLRCLEQFRQFDRYQVQILLGCVLPMICLYPHELLHAACFREDVYIYSNLKEGMLFVVGPEDMSRGRFIFMSLLPNLVLGLAPYIVGMVFPQLVFCAIFGALSTGMGGGDYYNVWNTLKQVPRGAMVYMYGVRSYWYNP